MAIDPSLIAASALVITAVGWVAKTAGDRWLDLARERRTLDVTKRALRQRFLAVWFELEAILLVFETPDLDAIQDTLDKAQARYELDDVAAAFSRHELDSMREALALLRRATRASQDYILTHRAERKLNLVVASNYEAGVSAIAKVLDVTDDPIQAQRAREVALELRDAQERLNQPIAGESSEPLTAIELETLRGMAHGLSNQMIADEQRRTINTVRTHISSILRKLGVDSRGEAVAKGRLEGLV